MGVVGVRFALGYATMVVFVYLGHIFFGLSLGVTLAMIAVSSVAGFAILICYNSGFSKLRDVLVHPASLLIAAGGVAIAFNGGIDYLPYGNDEFSHWLATPRLIYLGGGWDAVVDSLHLSHYPPGWQLTLLLPWQLSGTENFGLSAAAPFVLHVTVIALIYDIATFLLRRKTDLEETTVKLTAWAFTLLFLTAEGMGRLWTYTLLIEQPQVYSYAAVLLLIYAAETSGQDRKILFGAAGTVLASAFLYKAAALTFLPAVIALCGVMLFNRPGNGSDRLKRSLMTMALLAGPVLIAKASWSMAIDSNACSPFTLSSDKMAHVLSLDWMGLADRYNAAVWSYVFDYKFPLTLAAALGFAGAVVAGKYRAALVFAVLGAVYLSALYLYHLTCFGPYYFKELNSIPRFTRVPLQTFHALGLVMFLDVVLSFVAKRTRLDHYVRSPWIVGSLVVSVLVLGGWQQRQLYRSVVDTTTRAYQNVDPRIQEMRMAAKKIANLRGSVLPKKPVMTILSQGGDGAVKDYAGFFAMGYVDGKVNPHFTVSGGISWAPAQGNIWQISASMEDVVQQLSEADILWPITLDPWLIKVLERLVPDASCLNALPDKALVRYKANGSSFQFRCIEKQ